MILEFVQAVVIAVISSLIAVKLALRRFYSEKWWEQKLAAYTRIIEALSQMKLYADEDLRAYEERRELSAERRSELTAQWRNGQREVEKAVAIGAFVISPEATACAEAMLRSLAEAGENGGWEQAVYEEAAALDRCMKQMRELAREHLRVDD